MNLHYLGDFKQCTSNSTISKESISHTPTLTGKVQKITVFIWFLVPTWKAPPYNSPYLNWRRGMYAMTTGLFIVIIHRYIKEYFDRWSQLIISWTTWEFWINSMNIQEQDKNTIFSLKKFSDFQNFGLNLPRSKYHFHSTLISIIL